MTKKDLVPILHIAFEGILDIKLSNVVFPKIWVGLDIGENKIDLVAATYLMDKQGRKRNFIINEIKEAIQKKFCFPLVWNLERDACLRATELYGRQTLLKI